MYKKQKGKLMETNRLKIQLTKLLKDRTNQNILYFFDKMAQTESGGDRCFESPRRYMEHKMSSRLKTNRLRLTPFFITENSLVVDVTICYNEENNNFYNEILFSIDNFGHTQGYIPLNPEQSVPLYDKYILEFDKKKIRIYKIKHALVLSKDFDIERKQLNTIIGIEFDFDKFSMKIIGDDKKKFKTVEEVLELIHKDGLTSFRNEFSQVIEREKKSNKIHKELISTYRLDSITEDSQSILPVILYHLIKKPYFRNLIQKVSYVKLILKRIRGDYNKDKSNNTLFHYLMKLDSYFPNENFPESISRLDENLFDFYEQFSGYNGDYTVNALDETIEYLNLLKKHTEIPDSTTAQYILEATRYSYYSLHIDYAKFNYLSYLINCGFKLDELFNLLLKMDRTQYISFKDGLETLYRLNFFSECVNGYRSKVVSDSIKLDTDGVIRQTYWMLNDNNRLGYKQVREVFDNRLKHLFVSTPDIIIEGKVSGDSSLHERQITEDLYKDKHELICRLPNGSKEYRIYLHGLNITNLSSNVPPKVREQIRRWAEEKGIHIDSLNAKR